MASGFGPQEVKMFREAFDEYDRDQSGKISVDELQQVLAKAGEQTSVADCKRIVAEVDENNDGEVDFSEFLQVVNNIRGGTDKSAFGKVFKKTAKANIVQTATGAQHSFTDDEKIGFTDYINQVLEGDADLKAHGILPMRPESNDLWNKQKNGILLCKLINDAVAGTIDERAINKGKTVNHFQITENQNLVINSAKAIGCTVVNVGVTDLTEAREHMVLGLVWQIIRIGLLAKINIKNHPYLVRLLEDGESLEDFLKLPPDQILLRWFNYHLKNAGWPRRVKNFSGDIKDGENYTILLDQLDKQCDRAALQEHDKLKRAEIVLQNADKINCRKFLRPADIVSGNPRLNLAFVANLFNTCPGLEPLEEEEVPEIVEVVDETREEKAFRMWMNSLPVDPYVNHLYDDLMTGIIILQIEDKIQPGCVNWKKVNMKKPLSKFKALENCNYAVDIGNKLGFSLVGIGGPNILEGDKKRILAIVWQCMRMYILNFLKTQFSGKNVTDDDIIRWSNDQVKASGQGSPSINSFKDKSIANGRFLLHLLWQCQNESVKLDLIESGHTEESKKLNAQYAISCARKMGCTVFLLWQDIVEVKPKLLMTFFGAVMSVFGN